ncbi:D-alanyl-D-alanine carboxypeptidase [Candidatus Nitrosoglobus terrae]|uniref:serine-type D-Ala-D-Ala carboxypeptidase n=1 Tax=Candidatus Nitrosoglobus terrae TaxID=1630141 RepID=A0A1Q2SLD4_9GAMM|nr:D-alanyl-D-alanine carboxypeptidase family protein [Candidatus Nitrosoglobus terrae]BAW79930.1 D-alanyl-D-alanine carboxypeptidase [Candidatus Nitrosoglobus terrae]
MKSYRYFSIGCWILLLFVGNPALGQVSLLTPSAPTLSAKTYILEDFTTGQVLVESQSNSRIEPASITKLMTSYVVFSELKRGNIHLEDEVLISENAWRTGGSRTFIEVNTRVPVEILVKGMIIQSGNDASVALAEQIGGTEEVFVALMNQQAQRLGMLDSHFENSTGLPSQNHYMTARDIAVLARAIIQDFPEYYPWYSEQKFTYNNINQYNRDTLLKRDPSVDGLKTGYTKAAGYCLVSSAKRNGMRLISVVMGAASPNIRENEALTLLNYGFRFYDTRGLYTAKAPVIDVRVWQGVEKKLSLGLANDLSMTLPRGQWKELSSTIQVEDPITAPIAKGAKLGAVVIKLGEKAVLKEPLIALTTIPEGSWWQRMNDWVLSFFNKESP